MNGYSRIRKVSKEKSKSIDFSDISFVPKTKLSNPIKNQYQTSIPHENIQENQMKKNSTDNIQEPIQENDQNEEDTGGGEIFGVILSRKCSVSSNSSKNNNFLSEKKGLSSSSSSSVNNSSGPLIKRTLISSIKRSSSVSEGYSRIHHQSDHPDNDDDDDNILMLNKMQTRSVKKKGKFFKACKRMLGF